MKLFITGVSGLLGINLALETMHRHEVIGLHRGRLKSPPFRGIQSDFLKTDEINLLFDAIHPDWLINCAALAHFEECEKHPDQAKLLNVDFPAELASACAQRNIKLIHLSTDAVFDGKKEGVYTEEDKPNPQGVYPQTKLAGERAIQAANPNAIIARVNFYGWSLGGRRSLGEFFVNNLSEGQNVNGFTDVIFCPMWVNHLGHTLIEMLEKNMCGLYHVVGAQAMSKYQFGMEVARKFGLRASLVEPQSLESSGLTVRRSYNLWLSTQKLSTDLGKEIPLFSTGLDGFYRQFEQGYPQKIREYQK